MRESKGNFVSEWFGYRVFPSVAGSKKILEGQGQGSCPFLTEATLATQQCVKPAGSHGVCTISSCSNGIRQDWLVCPYRALAPAIFEDVAVRLFQPPNPMSSRPIVIPGPTLAHSRVRAKIKRALEEKKLCVVFLQDKLGGEISISQTDRSPEVSFDITMVELISDDEKIKIGRFGIFEIQTMDFHGSYRSVVGNLKDALRLHKIDFHKVLEENPKWLSEKIEGPNIANVFKRTFYQIMLKFQIGAHESCAGTCLAIPASVWDSWQRHLGKPTLKAGPGSLFHLTGPDQTRAPESSSAWIYVFDIKSSAKENPNHIVIDKIIATNSDSLAHFAFHVAPEAALAAGGVIDFLPMKIKSRLAVWWPDLGS